MALSREHIPTNASNPAKLLLLACKAYVLQKGRVHIGICHFGTKGGRFRYMSISVQTMSRSVHSISAYAISVNRQYNFSTQLVHQEYDFGTCLEQCEKQRVS